MPFLVCATTAFPCVLTAFPRGVAGAQMVAEAHCGGAFAAVLLASGEVRHTAVHCPSAVCRRLSPRLCGAWCNRRAATLCCHLAVTVLPPCAATCTVLPSVTKCYKAVKISVLPPCAACCHRGPAKVLTAGANTHGQLGRGESCQSEWCPPLPAHCLSGAPPRPHTWAAGSAFENI